MRLIILAKDSDDGLDWLDRFLDLANVERTSAGVVGDVYDARATIVCPEMYDQLGKVLDPDDRAWMTRPVTKIIRTAAWIFDERVVGALARLHARHPLCDPTGLLGPSDAEISARRGWAPDGRSAPIAHLTQRNVPRQKAPRTARRVESLNAFQ